uniref:Uncharacterized protein n=1 Tax=Vitis vinifera TaxID=29760 RepID=F6HKC1_VITVI
MILRLLLLLEVCLLIIGIVAEGDPKSFGCPT